ncbi:MAG: NAD(P)H-hydrate dehydratase [Gemmatimonadota bacterium]|nr:MAG: NAD(P)H-hydrate dehydratase [Gemmatimonadota bacterium]
MKVVTTQQMREIDRVTIEEFGIPGLDLMEAAGQGVVNAIEGTFIDISHSRVIIFCGKGNNGGDGFVVSRLLTEKEADVETYLLGKKSEISGDAKVNLDRAVNIGLNVKEISSLDNINKPLEADIVVDAILGTGIQGSVRGFPAEVIDLINKFEGTVVAVDTPSGLNTDTGAVEGPCVRADVTATMGLPKVGLLLFPGKSYVGKLEVVDIGVPPEVIGGAGITIEYVEREGIARLIPRRAPNAHKGDCGRVAVVAGSVGMTGAAALSCQAALRAGAGMTILGIPRSLNDVMEIKLTETMTKPLPETKERTLSLAAESGIEELMDWADVLAIGPGLSLNKETQELVRNITRKVRIPTVIDADGLNALAGHHDCLADRKAELILTPHAGELSRLIDRPIGEIEAHRISLAQKVGEDLGVVLVLKGAPTVVADPTGTVHINSTGNAGMATAGCGDVLTGLIAGLLAQGLKGPEAAVAGVFLHGAAGDLAAEKKGTLGVIAGDIAEKIPAAIRHSLKSKSF